MYIYRNKPAYIHCAAKEQFTIHSSLEGGGGFHFKIIVILLEFTVNKSLLV
jgi:hypothetical protein